LHWLDPSGLEKKASSGGELTFKETASLINAVHAYVEKIDAFILGKLDRPRLFQESLRAYLNKNPENHGFRTRIFDVESDRWPVFVSNWAGHHLGCPPLNDDEFAEIRKIVPGLKRVVV